MASSRRALPEAVGENHPARSQVLDGDLAGVLLVHRRQVVEADALLSFIASSSSMLSLPRASARLTTTRSTRRARTMAGMSLDGADDPRVDDRRADPGRVADPRTRRARRRARSALEELPGERHRGASRADNQQALRRPAAQGQPLERDAPARDQRDDERPSPARTRRGR